MSELRVRTLDGAVIIDLTGPLGREGGEAILQAVQQQPVPPCRLVFNFSQTGAISTAGFAGVLWAVRQVSRAGGEVTAYGLSDHLRKVCHVLGLTHYMRICLSEPEALE